MKAVPWWYQTLCGVLAVMLAVWLGLHYRAPAAWLAIYGAITLLTPALPAHRIVGVAGAALGLAIAACGGYLLRDALALLSLHDLVSLDGGLVSPTREALGFLLATTWLLAGSLFRIFRA